MSYLVPWFIMFRHLELIDSYLGLTASHLVISLPLAVWLMIGFFEDIPQEIEEAAEIDGCRGWRPSCTSPCRSPATESWRRRPVVHLLLEQFPVRPDPGGPPHADRPRGRVQLPVLRAGRLGGLAAAATIITLPVLVFIFLIHKQIVRGLTFGAVKG